MSARLRRGAAMLEAALALAMLTPLVFAAVRLGFGVNQVHGLESAVRAAAQAGAACAADDAIRAAAVKEFAGLDRAGIEIERLGEPGHKRLRVSVPRFAVSRLQGAEPLSRPIEATLPLACD